MKLTDLKIGDFVFIEFINFGKNRILENQKPEQFQLVEIKGEFLSKYVFKNLNKTIETHTFASVYSLHPTLEEAIESYNSKIENKIKYINNYLTKIEKELIIDKF